MSTFIDLVNDVCNQINNTSTEAQTRVGRKINDRYKRVTSSIGVQEPRRTTVQATTVDGVQTLTFTGIEKLYNLQDRSSGSTRIIDKELGVDEIRELGGQSGSTVGGYAILNTTATTITVLLDIVPDSEITLYADGMANANILSGANEPAFSESYHDILYYGALADEYRKLMRKELADDAERLYEKRLGEFRLHLASSAYRDRWQGKRSGGTGLAGAGSGGGSGSSANGASSYTQTGLISFDRSSVSASAPPFAVNNGAGEVSNLDAEMVGGYTGAELAVLAEDETVAGDWTFDGYIHGTNQPRCSAYTLTQQSLTSGLYTAVAFELEDFDTANMHHLVTQNSRVTIPVDGLYLITAQARFASNATGYRGALIQRSTTSNIAQVVLQAVSTHITILPITTIANLSAGDYLELFVVQSSGGALNTGYTDREATNFLQVVKLW